MGQPKHITLWQGSSTKYDGKLNPDFINSGEGAQVFGYGHYMAENKNVANFYKDALSIKEISIKGVPLQYQGGSLANSLRNLIKNVSSGRIPFDRAKEMEVESLRFSKVPSELEDADVLDSLTEDSITEAKGGYLYEFQMLKSDTEHMLDWDKPLHKQNKLVATAIDKLLDDDVVYTAWKSNGAIEMIKGDILYKAIVSLHGRAQGGTVGAQGAQDKSAATALSDLGVVGVKYLDSNNRDNEEGTRNHVIFPDFGHVVTPKSINEKSLNTRSVGINDAFLQVQDKASSPKVG